MLAASSPTMTTASPGRTPRAASARASPATSARISREIALPSMSRALPGAPSPAPPCAAVVPLAVIRCSLRKVGSAREVDRARLANHDHLDLARVLELGLD